MKHVNEVIAKLESKNKLESENPIHKLDFNLELFIKAIYQKVKNGRKKKSYQYYDDIWVPKLEINCKEVCKSR